MNNLNTSDVSEHPSPSIKRELAQLYDSYREFQHYCAFYCKSSSVMIDHFAADLDVVCTEGVERFAQMVIDKADGIEAQLKQLMHRA